MVKGAGKGMRERNVKTVRTAKRFVPFRVVAPNRVDLAGGTLDIYPLYLLVEGALTVNAAVAVRSSVEVCPYRRGAARLYSGNYRREVVADDTHGIPLKGTLGLLSRALRHFPAVRGVEIVVHNEAPVGSGLGASSALLVALMTAMGRLTGASCRWEKTAAAAMEIEAAHLRTLTGRQDHVAALRGGVQRIRFHPGRLEVDRLAPGGAPGRTLEAHGFLAHTGIAHFSGGVNWRMIRGAIEGNAAVLRKFHGIAAAAGDAWEAVRSGDAGALGAVIAKEWEIRRTLARGVSPRKVEELIRLRRFRRAVSGAKLCGAGNGGMLFGMLRDPGDRTSVEAILSDAGMEVVPFRLAGGARVGNRNDG